jgi:DNA polymerase IIIc chi subunit
MRKIAYYPEDDIKELPNFMHKILENCNSIAVFAINLDTAKNISQTLWSAYKFIPNQLHGEAFWEVNPICIFYNKEESSRKILLNFCHEIVRPNEAKCDTFIAWNYNTDSSFEKYKQIDQKWRKFN